MIARLRLWARKLHSDIAALSVAARDPRTPWYARFLVICVVGYALSPIDLIPDPIPVLGYLDDIVLLPLGIALAIRLIPAPVMLECREAVSNWEHRPGRIAAAMIVGLWVALTIAGIWLVRSWAA